jgi:hypothetical protein
MNWKTTLTKTTITMWMKKKMMINILKTIILYTSLSPYKLKIK